MACSFLRFHCTREILFTSLSIVVLTFSFLLIKDINTSKDLKIKTSFISNNINNQNNPLLNILENDEINIYEIFFSKYNLNEGQTFIDNEDIKFSLNSLNGLSITIIVFLFIFILVSLFQDCYVCSMKRDLENGFTEKTCSSVLICIIIIKGILLFILFGIYIGFFISYKSKFENDFFEFYDSINNSNEQILFENYYYSLFDLKRDSLLVVISLIINIILYLCFFIFYLDPCECFGQKYRIVIH